jgi:molybdenum cofactor cytidylyltransferase
VLAAVILSAGKSSRMGSPKALLPFRGRAFLDHLLEVARRPATSPGEAKSEPGIGWTRVVLGAHAEEITSALALDPSVVVVNPAWEQGQLTSIQAAIRSLPEGQTDGIILFLVDHPLISADVVNQLIKKFYATGKPIVLPTYRGKRGHPVIFSERLYGELLEAPKDLGARVVVWAHAADVLEVPTDEEGVVLNLNDPDTLRRAMGRM